MNNAIDQIIEALEEAKSALGDQRVYSGEFTRHGYLIKDKVSAAIELAKQVRSAPEPSVPDPTPSTTSGPDTPSAESIPASDSTAVPQADGSSQSSTTEGAD